MSFEEAVTHPFTAEQQPSLQNGRRTNNKANMGGAARHGREINMSSESEQNKILKSKFIRGSVKCNDCKKPRCLYSLTTPSRMKLIALE